MGFFKNFKSTAGIYKFTMGTDSYIGSTKDIYNRCFIKHKNDAFTKTKRHKLFYDSVVKNGWSKFTFNLSPYGACVIPNHVDVFAEKFKNHILTDNDLVLLKDLTSYELTVAEQLCLDFYEPSLNGSFLANWSTYNVGSTGYVRSKKMNSNLSLSFLNRTFSESTRELHKKNNLGKKLSEATKLKMSKSSGGVGVTLISFINESECIKKEFKTKSILAKELNISLRTVNRWIEDGKIHSTKSSKYPKVKLII